MQYVYILKIQLKSYNRNLSFEIFTSLMLYHMCGSDDVCDFKCHCSTTQLRLVYIICPPDGNKHWKTNSLRAGLSPTHSVMQGVLLNSHAGSSLLQEGYHI